MPNPENLETIQLNQLVSGNLNKLEREAEKAIHLNLKGDEQKKALESLKDSKKNYQEKRTETQTETHEALGEVRLETEENYTSPEAKSAKAWAKRLIEVQKVIWFTKLGGKSKMNIEKYAKFAEEALFIHLYYNLKEKTPQKITAILKSIKADGDQLVEYTANDSWPTFRSEVEFNNHQQEKLKKALEQDYHVEYSNFAIDVLPHLVRIEKGSLRAGGFQKEIEKRTQVWTHYYEPKDAPSEESWQCYQNISAAYQIIPTYEQDASPTGIAMWYSLNRYLDKALNAEENLTKTRQRLIDISRNKTEENDRKIFTYGHQKTNYPPRMLTQYFKQHPEQQTKLKDIPLPEDEPQKEKWWATRFTLESEEQRSAMVTEALNSVPKNLPITRLDLNGKIDEEAIIKLQIAITTYQSLSKKVTDESDKKNILSMIEKISGLNLGKGLTYGLSADYEKEQKKSEPFNEWTQTMTQGAREFLETLKESDQSTTAETLLNHLDIFVEECVKSSQGYEEYLHAHDRQQSFGSYTYNDRSNKGEKTQKIRIENLQKKHPSFLSLILLHPSPQIQSWMETYKKIRKEKLIKEVPSLKKYISRKSEIIESAKKEVRRAQLSYDAQTEGLSKNERQYLDNMERYARGELPKIFDELPWAFGTQKENLERMSTRLAQHTKFPKIDIRNQPKNFAGTTYPEQNRYEIDDNELNYESYTHTSIHETLHTLVGNTEGQSNFYHNLSEGITEMLSQRIARKIGYAPTYVAYPGVVEFAHKMDRLDPEFSSIFYTRVNTPEVKFDDLPKVGVDGMEKTYLDGITLKTPEEKYLCRVIFNNMKPEYFAKDLSYTQGRDAFNKINPFLRDLFNTNFEDNDYANGVMDEHYFKLVRRLEELET